MRLNLKELHRRIDQLYYQGVNVCQGCDYERTASCEGRERLCAARLEKYKH